MAEKVAENISLSEIQKLVNEKFNTRYTFMEIRIMASELDDVDWGRNDPAPAPEEATAPADAPAASLPADGAEVPAESAEGVPSSGTTVEVNKIVQPGMMFSGTVNFGSGVTAEWYIDGAGRLGLSNASGQPTEQDVAEFQEELRKVLR